MPQGVWDQELERVRQLKDSLGMPVDPGIEDLVTVLRLLGFDTVASCQGHADRVTGGPYVMVQSKQAQLVFGEQQKLADSSGETARTLLKKARDLNTREGHRLELLLDRYYESRAVTWGKVLEVRSVGYVVNRLCFVHAESDQLFGGDLNAKRLRLRQDEMKRFATFLRDELLDLGGPKGEASLGAA